MAKFDVADLELKLARGKGVANVTIPGADVRELLSIADRADDPRIEKLKRVRKNSEQPEVKLNGQEYRALLTLAVKAQKHC